jgi:putative ABC transport system substrate-binding protein
MAMQRREFMAIVGAAAAWPLGANAQKPPKPVIGVLESGTAASPTNLSAEFHAGLKESGFVEGQNVTIEYRRAEAQYDRLPALAADLVGRQVAVIVASGATVSPFAAQAATKTIPIVFFMGTDPVQTGLVVSLNQPGGNITGITTFGSEMLSKQLEMLHELVPKARSIAMLVNPSNPTHLGGKARWQRFADAIGVSIESVNASAESEFEPAIAGLAERRIEALNVVPDTLFASYRESLVTALARHAVPAIFATRESVVAGGLISYGASYAGGLRQLGSYVGRVLKGEKPADLPVLQPTKFDLAINLKTAKALGLAVPNTLLAQATEVFE